MKFISFALPESEIVPYETTTPPGERVLVLAPHPDDETLGCGGTLRLLVEAKKHVKVIFLTSGDKADPSNPKSYSAKNQKDYHPPLIPPLKGGRLEEVPTSNRRVVSRDPSPLVGEGEGEGGFSDKEAHITAYSLLREKEAEKALRVLGVSDYEFLRFPDRGVHAVYDGVLNRLLKVVEGFLPDTIYSPSMLELNPDHRAAAALSMEIQRSRMQGSAVGENLSPMGIVFYEVTTPLRPNLLVDVTSVYSRKKRAIKRYKSQLRLMDYLGHITALNTFRSLTVNGPQYIEAFWFIDGPLSEEERGKWLSYR